MTWSQIIVVGWLQFALASFGILWLARCALRRMPQPVDRSRIIQCTLAATTLLPLLIAIAPWPAWRLEIVSPVEEVVTAIPPQEFPRQEPAQSPFTSDQIAPFASDDRPIPPRPEVAETAIANQPPVIVPSPPKAKPDVSWLRILNGQVWTTAMVLIIALHAAALLCFLGLRCLGWVQLRRLCHAATAADDALVQTWNRLTQQQGKHVRLLVSPTLDVPLMFGWRHPVVLIPRKLVDAGGAALSYCLVHEWAHIERHDFLAWRCVDACQILFWMQPVYWSLRKELRLCQDLLADNRSTQAAGDAIEYSALLVDFARQQMVIPVAGALTFMDQPSQLTRRVKMLLERTFLVRTRCTWKFSLAAVTTVGLLVLMISAIRIEATRAEDANKKVQSDTAKQEPEAKPDKPAEPAKQLPEALKYFCKVVDKETGKGIPNARVVIRRSIYLSDPHRIVEESKHITDAEGKYVVDIPPEQVAEGSLYIEIDAEHDEYAAKKGHGYGLGLIRKNEKLGERPFFETTELYPAEPVTGTIVSPDGIRLAGVKVQGFSMGEANNFDTLSFYDSLTDAEGVFRLNCHNGSDAVLWVLPKDFAPIEKFLAKQRGDLGEFRLAAGIRVTGRVLGIDQKPIAGVAVNIDFSGDREVTLPVATSVRRGVVSNAEGGFAFDPLPTGQYRLTIDEHLQDPLVRDRTRYPVESVFLPRRIELKADREPTFQEFQAVPYVVIHAQNLKSKGEKSRGHEFHVFGRLDGQSWFGSGRPSKEGTIELKVPHGLQEVQINLMANEHEAMRYRLGKGEPLRDDVYSVQLGTLNDNIEGFEIIRYKAPIVTISAVDSGKQQIKDLQIKAKYAKPRPDKYISFANGSDISFERQNDGKYRTSQMLPDEDMTFTITADGYAPIDEKVNLKEGETRDLSVTFKKADGSDDKKTSATTPAVSPPAVAKSVEATNIAKPVEPAKEPAVALKYLCSVVDHDTGNGIFGAVVVVKQVTASSSGVRLVRESKHLTDPSGNYPLEIPAELATDPALRFEFEIDHENYAAVRREYSALSISDKLKSNPKFERIELHPGQAVTGVLVSPEGRPQPNVPLQSFWIVPPPRNVYSSSFNFARTDQQGKFRVVVPNGADAVLWVLPKDYAAIEKLIPKERGDLGMIHLSPGIRVSGTVLSANGEPLAKSLINIEYIGDRSIGDIPVGTSVSRGTFTDAEGRFAFNPLPPGNYRLKPGEYLQEHALQDFSHHPLQGVFRGEQITLKNGLDPAPQQIQAIPHVVFRAKFVDSAGQPTSGHQIGISGQLDGENWQSNTIPAPRGEVSMYIPHGLRSARLRLINNDLRAERYRLAKGKPLVNFPGEFGDIELGTLNDDLDEFEVVRYQAPTLLVSAADPNQKPIPGFRVQAKYPGGQQQVALEGNVQSDIGLYREADGRFRSARMLPDEDFTITVSADGYQPVESTVNLKEGETSELSVTMKASDASASDSLSK